MNKVLFNDAFDVNALQTLHNFIELSLNRDNSKCYKILIISDDSGHFELVKILVLSHCSILVLKSEPFYVTSLSTDTFQQKIIRQSLVMLCLSNKISEDIPFSLSYYAKLWE